MQIGRERFHANQMGKGSCKSEGERFHANEKGKVSHK